MSNPTSNFGWQMPTATDLVTDLPADFEVFGQAVDTALMDLKGGTTGQVLAKASGTDMDFVWSTASGMTNPMTTTGDMIYSSSGSTPARLGIGTTGQVITVAGGIPSWATAADNFQLINAGGTALTGATTITVSGISGKNSLMIWVSEASSATASSYFYIRFNTDSSSLYRWAGLSKQDATMQEVRTNTSDTEIEWARQGTSAANAVTGFIKVDGANATGTKTFSSTSSAGGATPGNSNVLLGTYDGALAITSVSIISSVGNFDAGTIYVYGA